MRPALLLTAFDRPQYLATVLDSWADVPELTDWHVRFALEPGPVAPRIEAQVADFIARAGLVDVEVRVNDERLGVSRNPHRHLGALFDAGYDFVVSTEDDLVVADDVLRLFTACAVRYAPDPAIAAVCAYSGAPGPADPAALQRRGDFSPWVWGTWRDRWDALIGPTWDLDYSTWNDSPGFESGWDWNLNTRVLPAHGLGTIGPAASRVRNIGVVGQHGTAENFEPTPSFSSSYAVEDYVER